MSSVFSMLPDGILNASTRNVRRRNQTTSATRIDLVHSQSHTAKERVGWESDGRGAGICVFGDAVMCKGPLRGHGKVVGNMMEWPPGVKGGRRGSLAERRQHLGRMALGLHVLEHPRDPTLAVNEKGGPENALVLLPVHGLLSPGPVRFRDQVIRIGQQGEWELVLLLELLVRRHGIRRDAKDDRAGLLDVAPAVAEPAGLFGAPAGVVLRIEVQHNLTPLQRLQRDRRAIVCSEGEIRGLNTWSEHRLLCVGSGRRAALGAASGSGGVVGPASPPNSWKPVRAASSITR